MNPFPVLAGLEQDLNSFDRKRRTAALEELERLTHTSQVPVSPERPVANLHAHTFYSFNAYGYSPYAIAWLAKKEGFRLAGIVDFDVLDGVEEFLEACDLLGMRGSAGMETRVYLPEFASREINSPGEPGVDYHMGIGFTAGTPPPETAHILEDLRLRAANRNRMVVDRLNAHLAPLCVDYDRDVLPLTPAGNPTERHIVQAYLHAAESKFSNPGEYWARMLGMTRSELGETTPASPKLQNLVRTRLMKRGGAGYIAPTAETFPALGDVNRLISSCGALPCVAWLDGTSPGEGAISELLELHVRAGAAALNVVPDRNWNVADPQVRKLKVAKLNEIVQLAEELDLPLNVGTEMNSFGQRLVDDFDAPELVPLRSSFLEGAHFIYGHTALQRALGLGSASRWASAHFPDRHARNRFYSQIGSLITPGRAGLEKLRSIGKEPDPADLLGLFG